ncbi:MAG: Gfo/Idh/MocA family protein [Candidatus Helarchaeota archaeon]
MRLGVVGLGNWGIRVAREAIELLKEEKIDEVHFCDLDETRLKEFSEYNTTTDFNELLQNVDGIHICTENKNHYILGKKALERDIHCLIEKPLTVDQSHAFNLLEIALNKALVLKVGHIFRFANVTKKLREYYKNGLLGEVLHINLDWTHHMKPSKNTDVIWDLLPHPLDILNFITSDWPKKISGFTKSIRIKDKPEMAILHPEYESGLTATIHVSWINNIKRRRVEIIGSEKSIVSDCVNQTIVEYENNNIVNNVTIDKNNTIKAEIENFIEAIKTGKNHNNSGIIGLRTVELIESLQKELKNGGCN